MYFIIRYHQLKDEWKAKKAPGHKAKRAPGQKAKKIFPGMSR